MAKPHFNEAKAWQFVEAAIDAGETPDLAALFAEMETPAEAKARLEVEQDKE